MTSKLGHLSDRPIGRLRAVWLSYWSRPLIGILFSVAGLLLAGAAWSILVDQPRHSFSRSRTLADPEVPSPAPARSVLNSTQQSDLNWTRIKSLRINDPRSCRELWTPGAIPQLESLTVYGLLTSEQLIELCALYDLKGLNLHGNLLLTPEGMRAWEHEESLQYLRLLNFQLGRSSQQLPWPPNLHTLVCDDPAGVNSDRLREWQQLPLLESLSTRLVPSAPGIVSEWIEALRGFPRLSQLLLIELPPAFGDVFTPLQAALPTIRVRPNSFDPVPGQRSLLIIWSGLLVVSALLIQVGSQFVSQQRLLIPQFARSHILLAGALLGGSMLVSAIFQWWGGATLTASAAMGCVPMLAIAMGTGFFGLIHRLGRSPMPNFNNIGMVLPIMAIAFSTGLLFSSVCGLELDWFLRGHQPIWEIAIVLTTCWGCFRLVRWNLSMQRDLEEIGGAEMPLSVGDVGGWIKWGRDFAGVQQKQGIAEPYAIRHFDARFDDELNHLQSHSPRRTLKQWSIANPHASQWFRMAVVAYIGGGLIVGRIVPGARSWTESLISSGGFPLFATGLFIPILFASQRKPMVALELLRPVSRQTWAFTWFGGIALEITSLIAIALLWIFVTLISFDEKFIATWSSTSLTTGAIMLPSVAALLFALGMLSLTLRSAWALSLAILTGWAIITGAMLGISTLRFEAPHNPSLIVFSAIVVVSYLIAGVAIWSAWRRWMNWEVGREG